MTQMFSWFDDWRDADLACTCGWSGWLDKRYAEPFDALMHFECRACDEILAIVSYPTAGEVEVAAHRAQPEAMEMLDQVREAQRAQQEFERVKLRSGDQLPDLDGDALEFVYDLVAEDHGRSAYVISCGVREIWREPAAWEDWERHLEVKDVLRARYRGRFRLMKMTPAARSNLVGDDISAFREID